MGYDGVGRFSCFLEADILGPSAKVQAERDSLDRLLVGPLGSIRKHSLKSAASMRSRSLVWLSS